jgi:adenosylcobinamide kinase/adenosylcobinamide-phosphate guanylyltransferase
MKIDVLGSAAGGGWPEPRCRCASCLRAAASGSPRGPFRVLIDGILELTGAGAAADVPRYRVRPLAGGWDLTAPDGTRLLAGAHPEVPAGTPRYDAVLLGLAGDPAQLGSLRASGAVTGATLVLAGFADHRIRSERELARRCGMWRARVARDGDTFTVPGAAVPAGRRGPWRVLVLGGARSGKSEEAELRVAAEPSVTYVATGRVDAADPEWTARIAAHRARRPAWWHTVESTGLGGVLREARGAVLVDSVTAWLAAAMDECGVWDGPAGAGRLAAGRLAEQIDGLVAAWRQADAYVVAVSDETGLGVVPGTRAGRMFRDELGRLNQRLAAESDEFTVVVAGRPLVVQD